MSVCSVSATTRRGTSLVEILVVIVVFLVGILAVVQIFPRGFRLLSVTRNNGLATALARSEAERLKASPDGLPDMIQSGFWSFDANNNPVFNATAQSLNDLGPMGDVDGNGDLLVNGNPVAFHTSAELGQFDYDNWFLYAGANRARHIVGEGRRVPAPRPVGNDFGGLMVLSFNPIDVRLNANGLPVNMGVYANDLLIETALPTDLQRRGTDSAGNQQWSTPDGIVTSQAFAGSVDSEGAYLLLPTSDLARAFRVRLRASVVNGSNYRLLDLSNLTIVLPPASIPAGDSAIPPLVQVNIEPLLASQLQSGERLASVEADTLGVAPRYEAIPAGQAFTTGNPYQYKLLDPYTGVLLFSPYGNGVTIERPGGAREPLEAHVDYDVLDWRILREDFRADQRPSSGGVTATYQLALQNLKVGGQAGTDGKTLAGMFAPETSGGTVESPANQNGVNYFAVIDLQTGGLLFERGADGTPLVLVDKSAGVVTLNDADPGRAGLQAQVLLPGDTSGTRTEVDLDGRTLRALYMGRNEWAVQPLKAPSRYVLVGSRPGDGQYAPGFALSGGSPTRLYFPSIDAGRKVTIDTLNYTIGNGQVRSITGQDFVVGTGGVNDSVGLPYIDLLTVDPDASSFTGGNTYPGLPPAQGVKGASLSVRVLWNPDFMNLTNNTATNATAIDRWGRGFRKSIVQTYLAQEEIR